MHFTQLRSFQAVALAGSFTGAAKRLNLSQPTITRQVGELEDQYGVELFYRRGRRVELSEVGKSLLAITERVFAPADEATELLQTASRLGTGHLRVSAVGPIDVIHAVHAFAREYPGVSLSLTICNSETATKSLLDFRADVAMLASSEPDNRFHYVDFASRPLVLYVQKDHPWAKRRSVRFRDLAGEPVIMREVGSVTRLLFETACARANLTPNVRIEINNRDAFREAIAQGLGIGVIGERGLAPDQRLRCVRISDIDVRMDRQLACLKERRNARLIRAFMAAGESVVGQLV